MARKVSIFKYDSSYWTNGLANMQTFFEPDEVHSKYHIQSIRKINISSNLYEALRIYAGYGDRTFFCAKNGLNGIAELMTTDNSTTQVVIAKKEASGYRISAALAEKREQVVSLTCDYKLLTSASNSTGYNGTAILLALMPIFFSDEEAMETYNELLPYLEFDMDSSYWSNPDNVRNFALIMAKLNDNFYCRCKTPISQEGGIGLLLETNDDIYNLRMETLSVSFTDTRGSASFFKKMSFEDFKGSYSINKYGDERDLQVSEIPTWYKMPGYVPQICELVQDTTDFPAPIRTGYLIGPAGTGKTAASKAVFSGLGLLYDHITCHPQMELFEFIGQIFPNTNPSQKVNIEDIREQMGLPSTDDIMNNPKGSYVKMYKTAPPDSVDEGTLISEMCNMVMKKVSELCDSNDYTYVESGLIKAARYGYGYEVQEIGIVQRAGVAVGLNALLESGENNFITLPTGEVIKKHPSCVIIFTSNDEYEGTNNLNQSVLSRMGFVYWFKNPSKEIMCERVLARTKFPDEVTLLQMAEIIEKINLFCHSEKNILDGVCGPRELENWAMAVMTQAKRRGITGSYPADLIREMAQITVLNKASQTAEDVMSIAEGCIDAKYGILPMFTET